MAVLDVLTLDEAKQAVSNNAGDSNDALLGAYITGVSGYLDRICGAIVQRTVTDEICAGGLDVVILDQSPVVSVTSVTEYAGTSSQLLTEQTLGVTPDYGFDVNKNAGILTRFSGGCSYTFGRSGVKVTYVAGRFTDTASVDERFKDAARFTLANIYRRERGMAQMPDLQGVTFLLPNAAKALLTGELRMVS